jgi:hypothetical protein
VKIFMTIPDEIFEDLRREIDGHTLPPFPSATAKGAS